MEFIDILGQDDIKNALNGAISKGRINHAYIFCGENGIGKKSMAQIFSRKVLCKDGTTKGCICKSCLLFENNTHPDFFVVASDGNSIGVDKIRQMQSQVAIKPIYSDKKVFLILDAEKLTIQAQNALLKTLEEPPQYIVIILITNNCNALLETIQSRAVRYNFKKNTKDSIREYLTNKYGNNLHNVDFLVNYSDGKIGDLVDIIENSDINSIRDTILDFVVNIKDMKMQQTLKSMEFFEQHKEDIDKVLEIMAMFFRDLLILKKTRNYNLLTNVDKKDILSRNEDKFSCNELIRNIEIVTQSIGYVKRNVNFGLLLEVMILKLRGDV